MGYVYKITNTVNNKSYIGISIHEPEKRRIKAHLSGHGNRLIANAVKKYGKDAFTYEILEANVFDEFLPDFEVAYIANYNTVAPNGYNLDSGGSHKIPSEDTLSKLSAARKGKKHTEVSRRKISEALKGEKNHNYGKTFSDETRHKMSEAGKRKTFSAEHRRNLSEGQKSRKHKPLSTEHRRKISKALKGRISPNLGKPMSMEQRIKLSKAMKGRKSTFLGKSHSAESRRKISEAKIRPEYVPAHAFFISLPHDMPLRQKRKLLYAKFPKVARRTIRTWTSKWESSFGDA